MRARKAAEGIVAAAADAPSSPSYPTLPERMRLTEAHGFVNEYEAVYFKPQGAIITNPVEIAMLLSREAPLEEC